MINRGQLSATQIKGTWQGVVTLLLSSISEFLETALCPRHLPTQATSPKTQKASMSSYRCRSVAQYLPPDLAGPSMKDRVGFQTQRTKSPH